MNITVAHSEKFKDAQGVLKDKTVWVDCAYWSDRTGIAPYLKKGTQVYVEGTPDLRTFTKGDGSFGATITLRVQNIQLLGSRQDGAGGGSDSNQGGYSSAPAATINAPVADMGDASDDLPF